MPTTAPDPSPAGGTDPASAEAPTAGLARPSQAGPGPAESSTLPEKLRTLRRKQGLSQQDVAERLGITRQTVSNWEAGQGSPALDRAMQLATLYRVSLDELASTEVGVRPATPVASPDDAPRDLHVLQMAAGRTCKLGFSDTDLSLRIPSERPVHVTGVDADWLRVEYEVGRAKPPVRELIDVDALVCIDLLDENQGA